MKDLVLLENHTRGYKRYLYMNTKTQEVQEAKTVLQKEASAIQGVAQRLSAEEFTRVIDVLLKKDGKIVVTGIGKSGYVAKKIAVSMQHGFTSRISAPI